MGLVVGVSRILSQALCLGLIIGLLLVPSSFFPSQYVLPGEYRIRVVVLRVSFVIS
jgi:hypothetical protein